ncbi:uroporphyrinogen-III synthase/uroporphyrinogen III methyltransferase / synthase [Granulicella rosea]|uniref:Uroporphyrinogen-III synthase/uroporphyrinogen III methyltransferase / synthase n=2 Tax=Granulicella rosea TaxID=474952 RepID=A0A239J2N0_9BACT|nr:uroporphyrinogen-III synthase/uroporphyrinogen III methyltransferase / synthase [Granulicella rosea]
MWLTRKYNHQDMRPHLPLDGVRILITRTRQQASELAAQLESRGAQTLPIPTIELAEPASWQAMDAALADLPRFDWVVFTSANAVKSFCERREQVGASGSLPRVAVVGPATAKAALACGLEVDLMPAQYVAEALLAELAPQVVAGSRVLLARASEARDVLPEGLAAAGATVTIADAYRNVVPQGAAEALASALHDAARRPHAITFTSSSTATHLFALLEMAGLALDPSILIASIGPVTSRTLTELGHPPQIEAGQATIAGLVDALTTYFVE